MFCLLIFLFFLFAPFLLQIINFKISKNTKIIIALRSVSKKKNFNTSIGFCNTNCSECKPDDYPQKLIKIKMCKYHMNIFFLLTDFK